MSIIVWILLITVINSLLGGAGIFSLWMKHKVFHKLITILVAFSAGALLGGTFFHLMPEALEHLTPITAMSIAMFSFLLFFILEQYLHWHHCEKPSDIKPFSYLIVIGDGVHNFIDGLIIAATFFTTMHLGIITSLIILGHELPQELGIFAVLVHGNVKKAKALIYSILTQTTSILGGVVGFFFIKSVNVFSQYLLPFAAGGFLYIASADLIPEIHKITKKQRISSFFYLFIGIVLMILLKIFFN